MKHKCDIDPIKVYLASRMDQPVFEERRNAIVSYFERWAFFKIINFERGASEVGPEEKMKEDMKNSHMAIILLEGQLRPGVEKEYRLAKVYNRPILFYVDTSKPIKRKLKDFIVDIEQKYSYSSFHDISNLIDVIENDLIEKLLTRFIDYPILRKRFENLKKKPSALGHAMEDMPVTSDDL